MSKQYFELSTDYDLADKLLRKGQTLTMCTNGEFCLVKNNAGLGRCDELKENGSQFLLPVDIPNTTELQHSLTQALNECDSYKSMLDGVNEACAKRREKINELDQALTSIAKQLGLDHFDDEQVAIAIEELQTKPDIKQEIIEKLTKKLESRYHKIQTLEDNLTRSQSDRLSELTTIIRMIQALSDTPQDCYYGAIRLIHQVIYDQICRLDPTQSWDI